MSSLIPSSKDFYIAQNIPVHGVAGVLLKFPFGRRFLPLEISEERLEVVFSKSVKTVRDLSKSVRQSLVKPIAISPLRSLVKGKKICLVVPDITRACPTREILNQVLQELEDSQVGQLRILIGNGLHRAISESEMVDLLGEGVVEKYNVTNHVANDEKQLIDLGVRTSFGTPVAVNRALVYSS